MSVVFINNSTDTFTPTNSGAIATFLWECCRAAKEQTFEPVVISRNSKAKPYDWDKAMLIDYPFIPKNPMAVMLFRLERKLDGWRNLRERTYGLKVIRALCKAGLETMPLLLQNDPELAVLLRRRLPRARIYHHFHNQLECKSRCREAFGRSGIVSTSVSNFTGRWVEEFYQLPKGSVKTIYNGVDAERFHPNTPTPVGKTVVNFVGRTGIEKGVDLLLKAALVLANRTKSFEVQILGANHWGDLEMDEYQNQLRALAEELQKAGISVRRPGHIGRNELPAELQKAHIHVVPSRWDEPFGLTTIEGMASGLAVVASNTGGTPEVVGDAGLLFKRESVDELAEQLGILIADENLRKSYATRARTRAESFTWRKTWAEFRSMAQV